MLGLSNKPNILGLLDKLRASNFIFLHIRDQTMSVNLVQPSPCFHFIPNTRTLLGHTGSEKRQENKKENPFDESLAAE